MRRPPAARVRIERRPERGDGSRRADWLRSVHQGHGPPAPGAASGPSPQESDHDDRQPSPTVPDTGGRAGRRVPGRAPGLAGRRAHPGGGRGRPARPRRGATSRCSGRGTGRLADAGWAAPAWPVEHGGRGAGIDEQLAYLEEMSAAWAPGPVNVIGVSNIAPAIMAYGTDEQQERFLRPMLRGDEIWSQGMSEPDAGSDLASLRTRAVADGDEFVVNGQKTWNSLGHLRRLVPALRADRSRRCPSTRGSAACWSTCAPRASRSGRCGPSPASSPSPSSSSPRPGSRRRHCWARSTRGGQVAMTTLSFERAGVARLHLGLSRKLDRLLADPGGRRRPGRPEDPGPGGRRSTPTSPACVG